MALNATVYASRNTYTSFTDHRMDLADTLKYLLCFGLEG